MAGRSQGRHVFRDVDGSRFSIEVFWHRNGWFSRAGQLNVNPVEPFTTSSEAYGNAKAAHTTRPRSYEGPELPEASALKPDAGRRITGHGASLSKPFNLAALR
jgi:hypothetical protein